MPCSRNSGPAHLFGVSGARPFIADPETVDSHFQDLGDGVLADCFDAGEGEDRKRFAAGDDAVAQLESPFAVEEKVLVEDDHRHLRFDLLIALDHAIDVGAGVEKTDVFSLEEVRRAAEIAAVRTSESAEDHAGAGDFAVEHAEPADDYRMPLRSFALAEDALHERGSFFAADEIRPRRQLLIREHRAVAAEDDFRIGRIASHQRGRLFHPMKCRQHKRDPDVLRMLA